MITKPCEVNNNYHCYLEMIQERIKEAQLVSKATKLAKLTQDLHSGFPDIMLFQISNHGECFRAVALKFSLIYLLFFQRS